jgi:hypothetical protein
LAEQWLTTVKKGPFTGPDHSGGHVPDLPGISPSAYLQCPGDDLFYFSNFEYVSCKKTEGRAIKSSVATQL